MSIFDEDQKAMLDVYLYETNSLFEQLDAILIAAEKQSSFCEGDIHSIFRIMHTTKSSSSMMNLSGIAELMHTAEDLFSLFREHKERLNDQSQQTFDVLFAISDFMHKQLDHMKEDTFLPDDASTLIQKTKQLLIEMKQTETVSTVEDEENIAIVEPVSIPVEQEKEAGTDTGTYIRLLFEKESRMENIRAYMVATQIRNLCTSLEYYPDALEDHPETAEFIKEQGFYLHFEAEDHRRVLEQLHRALFVEKCEIIDKNEYHIHTQAAPKEKEVESVKPQEPVNETASVIPVHVQKLDQLQNLTGELMINETIMRSALSQAEEKELLDQFERSFHKMFLEIEDLVMSMRLVPISRIVPKLNRVVRDICHKEGKDVNFVVHGEDIEIDKEIVDHLFDPLMHLLRNGVDHGIEDKAERIALRKPEKGTITMQVENANGEIVIYIKDDGRGLDVARIKEKAIEKHLLTRPEHMYTESEIYAMILLPGFSTNKQVNEFSGRGVGMDVVKNMLDRFKGHIHIDSKKNKGTTFALHLPLTLTIVESMIFRCENVTFSVPTRNVVRFFPFDKHSEQIQEENGHMLYFYMDQALPVFYLREFFHLKQTNNNGKIMLYVKSSSKEACIIVDDIIGYQHIVDKPLPQLLNADFKKATGITGCSLLGDGEICMTLNVEYLLNNNQEC